MLPYLGAIVCTLALSVGQLLFKAAAKRLAASAPLDLSFLALFGSALALYGTVSIVWVLILQRLELSRAYPIMALSFVLVPLGEALLFKEPVSTQYIIGALMIVAGIACIGLRPH
jgi:drug/metabolite transporter (DMT)-like permease